MVPEGVLKLLSLESAWAGFITAPLKKRKKKKKERKLIHRCNAWTLLNTHRWKRRRTHISWWSCRVTKRVSYGGWLHRWKRRWTRISWWSCVDLVQLQGNAAMMACRCCTTDFCPWFVSIVNKPNCSGWPLLEAVLATDPEDLTTCPLTSVDDVLIDIPLVPQPILVYDTNSRAATGSDGGIDIWGGWAVVSFWLLIDLFKFKFDCLNMILTDWIQFWLLLTVWGQKISKNSKKLNFIPHPTINTVWGKKIKKFKTHCLFYVSCFKFLYNCFSKLLSTKWILKWLSLKWWCWLNVVVDWML
jgi:hypothetical protein